MSIRGNQNVKKMEMTLLFEKEEKKVRDLVQSNSWSIEGSPVKAGTDIHLDSRKSLCWINIYLAWLAFKLSFHTKGDDSCVGTFTHCTQSLYD